MPAPENILKRRVATGVGPSDLAAAMDYPGNPSHPVVKPAVLQAITRSRAAGRAAGVSADNRARCAVYTAESPAFNADRIFAI